VVYHFKYLDYKISLCERVSGLVLNFSNLTREEVRVLTTIHELEAEFYKNKDFENALNISLQLIMEKSGIRNKEHLESILEGLIRKGFLLRTRNNAFRTIQSEIIREIIGVKLRWKEDTANIISDAKVYVRKRLTPKYAQSSFKDLWLSFRGKPYVDKLRRAVEIFYDALKDEKWVEKPYKHQYEATYHILESIFEGKETGIMITAKTGEGKSEAFLAALFIYLIYKRLVPQTARNEPTALIIYPRKALSEDQLYRIMKYLYKINHKLEQNNLKPIYVGFLDGDTPVDWVSAISSLITINNKEKYFSLNVFISSVNTKDVSSLVIKPTRRLTCPICNKPLLLDPNDVINSKIEDLEKRYEILENSPHKRGLGSIQSLYSYYMKTIERKYKRICEKPPKLRCPNGDFEAQWVTLTKQDILKYRPDIILASYENVHLRLMERSFDLVWKTLRMIILDEVHEAQGIKGSHIAFLCRRLKERLRYNQNIPLFIGCSATISKAEEFGGKLFGIASKNIHLIKAEYEEEPNNYVYHVFLLPSTHVDPLTVTIHTSIPLACSLKDHKLLIFAESKDTVERFKEFALDAVKINEPWRKIPDKIVTVIGEDMERSNLWVSPFAIPFREKLKKGELKIDYHHADLPIDLKVSLVEKFKSNKINILAATTTLEFGIDIGDLNSILLYGFPRTLQGYFQRAGRAGRRKFSFPIIITVLKKNLRNYYYYVHAEDIVFGESEDLFRIPLATYESKGVFEQHIMSAIFDYLALEGVETGISYYNMALFSIENLREALIRYRAKIIEYIMNVFGDYKEKLEKTVGEFIKELLTVTELLYEIRTKEFNETIELPLIWLTSLIPFGVRKKKEYSQIVKGIIKRLIAYIKGKRKDVKQKIIYEAIKGILNNIRAIVEEEILEREAKIPTFLDILEYIYTKLCETYGLVKLNKIPKLFGHRGGPLVYLLKEREVYEIERGLDVYTKYIHGSQKVRGIKYYQVKWHYREPFIDYMEFKVEDSWNILHPEFESNPEGIIIPRYVDLDPVKANTLDNREIDAYGYYYRKNNVFLYYTRPPEETYARFRRVFACPKCFTEYALGSYGTPFYMPIKLIENNDVLLYLPQYIKGSRDYPAIYTKLSKNACYINSISISPVLCYRGLLRCRKHKIPLVFTTPPKAYAIYGSALRNNELLSSKEIKLDGLTIKLDVFASDAAKIIYGIKILLSHYPAIVIVNKTLKEPENVRWGYVFRTYSLKTSIRFDDQYLDELLQRFMKDPQLIDKYVFNKLRREISGLLDKLVELKTNYVSEIEDSLNRADIEYLAYITWLILKVTHLSYVLAENAKNIATISFTFANFIDALRSINELENYIRLTQSGKLDLSKFPKEYVILKFIIYSLIKYYDGKLLDAESLENVLSKKTLDEYNNFVNDDLCKYFVNVIDDNLRLLSQNKEPIKDDFSKFMIVLANHSLAHTLHRIITKAIKISDDDLIEHVSLNITTGSINNELTISLYEYYDGGAGILRSFVSMNNDEILSLLSEEIHGTINCPRTIHLNLMEALYKSPNELLSYARSYQSGSITIDKFIKDYLKTDIKQFTYGQILRLQQLLRSTKEIFIGLIIRDIYDILTKILRRPPTLPEIRYALKRFHTNMSKKGSNIINRLCEKYGIKLVEDKDRLATAMLQKIKQLISDVSLLRAYVEMFCPEDRDGCAICLGISSCQVSTINDDIRMMYLSKKVLLNLLFLKSLRGK